MGATVLFITLCIVHSGKHNPPLILKNDDVIGKCYFFLKYKSILLM